MAEGLVQRVGLVILSLSRVGLRLLRDLYRPGLDVTQRPETTLARQKDYVRSHFESRMI